MVYRRYKKLPKLIKSSKVEINATCDKCGVVTSMAWDDLRTEHSGGCVGHGPDEYCYCEGNQLTVSYECSGCKKTIYIQYEEGFSW